MVRLIKDAASPDREAQHRLVQRITDTFAGMGVAVLQMSAAVHKATLGLREALDPLYRASRAEAWKAQFPLYACPYALDYGDCEQVWDRRRVTAPELRTLVWEHVQTVHVAGERGQRIADQYVRGIMDRP